MSSLLFWFKFVVLFVSANMAYNYIIRSTLYVLEHNPKGLAWGTKNDSVGTPLITSIP